MGEKLRTLTIDGVKLPIRIVTKRVRNVNARLVKGELRVSTPPGVPASELNSIVTTLARRLLRRARAEVINSSQEALALTRRVASRFPEPPPVSELRFVTTQRSRWGSYSQKTGVVRVHAALRQMPCWVLEAVVAHEFAHAFHGDHSPAFWKLLRQVCPQTDRARAFLDGASWVAERWDQMPEVERALLGQG